MDKKELKDIVRTYYDYQKMRIAIAARLREYNNIFLNGLLEDVKKKEDDTIKYIKKCLSDFDIWNHFLKDIKGVGPAMASIIITEYDIEIATTVSKMWAFTGLVPGRDKRKKGEKSPFNGFLRSKIVGVLVPSFLKSKSEYADFYYNYKNRLESLRDEIKIERGIKKSKNPTDKKKPFAGHINNMAKRYCAKMFLKDLYVAWRTLEGLEVRKPYAEEYLDKKHSA